MRKIYLLLLFMSAWSVSKAQLKDIDCKLVLNKETQLYECYIVVNKGSAITKRERIQFNSQISIITPPGSTLRIVENHMPLQDNGDFTGKLPMKWVVANELRAIDALDGGNIFGVVPSMSPTSFYNELHEGNEVKLFSFKVSPLPICGDGVRLFENSSDPSSLHYEMRGGDFSNSITIGGLEYIYQKNQRTSNQLYPSGNAPDHFAVQEMGPLNLTAGEWSNASSFQWSGPFGFASNLKDPVIKTAKKHHSGTYTLKVKSPDGCYTEKKVYVNVQAVEAEALASLTNQEEGDNIIVAESRRGDSGPTSLLYPNPAKDYINLSIQNAKDQMVDASIWTVDGKLVTDHFFEVTCQSNTFEKALPLKLEAGVYQMRVKIGDNNQEHKFIVIE